MKKRDLQKMRTLLVTPTMMRMVAEDAPHIEKSYGRSTTIYKRNIYMRCLISGDILKVAFYLAEHIRSGGRNPIFELFISRKERNFITYDCQQKKWRTARLSLLNCSGFYTYGREKWASKTDTKTIQNYLGSTQDAYGSLLAFQNQIRNEELKRRHRKETDPWDADLEQTPELPKDWQHWVSKVGIPTNYIYYHYDKKGAKQGYCTYCEKEVPIWQPRHNAEGRCPCCRRPITFKSVGRAGTVI
ncbi:MAG: hypothetical protein AAGU32_18075, partial [Bacillota bacterium]